MSRNGSDAPIKIKGRNIDIEETLHHKAQESLLHVAKSHFGDLNHATVGFSREGHSYSCTINLQVSTLKVIIAEATANECHQAFDQALGKVGRQLHRRRQRMAHRSKDQASISAPA